MRRAFATGVAVLALVLLMGASDAEKKLKYPSPSELALSPDGRWLFAVCEGTNEVVVIDTVAKKIAGRVPVGRVPRGIALSADGKRAWVANSWDDTVTEIDVEARTAGRKLPTGFEPTGVVADRAGEKLYIANRLSNDISIVNLQTGKEDYRLVAGRGASYVTMSPDGGRVYSTHVYPNIGKHRTAPVSEITEVDARHHVVENREWLRNSAGVFRVALSNDGRLGIAAEIRPKNLIPLAHVEHGWAFVNSLAVFGADAGGRVAHMPLDELERVFSLPYSVAISADKKFVYVSASGSNEVAVVDAAKLLRLARSPGGGTLANDLSASAGYVLARIPVGRNPRGLALSADGSKLYVATRLDDAVAVIDTATRTVVDSIPMGAPAVLTPERRGERLFNSSRFAFHGAFGCANCHIDLTIDGLQWDLEPDGFGIDIVDNRSLEDVSQTAPFKWNGGNPDLETECGPRTERFFFRSQSYNREELGDVVAFIKAIPLRPNRYRLPDGEFTPAQERGKAIFERTTKRNGEAIPLNNQCAYCHSGPYHTNQQTADVGSGKWNDRSPKIDTAHLTNVVYSAPYLHDGSARTMEEIWTVFNPNDTHGQTNDLNKDELNDLIEYLKTL
ncbi:MAG: beta-propeller fold lactonase family protein [Bryobacteraceae bacterium]